MSVIAHRGWWYPTTAAQNTHEALCDALAQGWGVEFDLDLDGAAMVIRHGSEVDSVPLTADLLAALAASAAPHLWNVKAPGLGAHLVNLFAGAPRLARNAWVFDVELVDPRLPWVCPSVRYLARASDRADESLAVALAAPWASGIWLDTWEYDWVTSAVLTAVQAAGRVPFVCSPELHGRPIAIAEWVAWQQAGAFICTDLPHLMAGLNDPMLPLYPVDPWWNE